MNIETLDSFPPELDAVASASPRATFYHTGTWLASLADAYPRLALRVLVARDGSHPLAYLPYMVTTRGPFRALWSLPFGTYGGPVSASGNDGLAELMAAFRRSMAAPGVVEVGWVDFRMDLDTDGGETFANETHRVDLSGGFETVFQERYDKPRRRRIRRAEESGVTVTRADDPDAVRRFVAVYRDRLRDWDTGAGHPEQLFTSLVQRGGSNVRLYLAHHDGDVVGGHLNFYFQREVIAWYGMTSARGGELHAGNLLYSTCMRDACDAGFASYNLGSSLGKASLIEYKQSLGGVAYAYRTVRRRRALARLAAALLQRPNA